MRIRSTTFLIVTALGLAACSAETPAPGTGDAPPVTNAATTEVELTDVTSADATTDGPAGEVPADSRKPVDAPSADAPATPPGVDAAWAPYYATGIPFVFGVDAGLAEAKRTGKTAMLVYSATW